MSRLVVYAAVCAAAVVVVDVSYGRDVNFAPARFEGDAGLAEQDFKFAYYPTAGRIRVQHGFDETDTRSGVFRIKDEAGNVLFERSVVEAREWGAKIPDLKAATRKSGKGGYEAEFTEAADGRVQTIAFRRDVFDWEGTTLGLSDTVPEPFTPVNVVRRDGKTFVETILRSHELTSAGVVAQVTAEGREIFASPMRLVYRKDGKDVEIGGGGFSFTEIKKMSARGFADLSAPDFKGRIDAEWWCDGMVDMRLTVSSCDVDSLHLVIPLKESEAPFYHAVTDQLRIHPAGRVPDGEGVVWHSAMPKRIALAGTFVSYLWVGGTTRGFSVFGDNDRGWVDGSCTCQDIRRTGKGATEIWLNVFQAPVRSARPRTIRIGMEATPVKPLPKGWRKRQHERLVGCSWYHGTQTPCDDLETIDGTDAVWRKMKEARDTGKVDYGFVDRYCAKYRCADWVDPESQARRKDTFKRFVTMGMEQVARSHGTDMKQVFYVNGRGARYCLPPFRTFADEWRIFSYLNRAAIDHEAVGAYELHPVRSYLDYAVGWWRKMLESGACDYIYIDDVFPACAYASENSDAFRDTAGCVHPSAGIFDMREQIRRIAVMMAELGLPSGRNWIHMTNTAIAPISAFVGMHDDWEDNGAKTYIQDRYPRDYILAETLGRQFGVWVRLTGWFDGADIAEIPSLHESAVGVSLTHEIEHSRIRRLTEVKRMLEDWGYGDDERTTVWNYWDEDTFPVKLTGLDNSALAVRRDDGEALLVVSSWDRQNGVVTVEPSVTLVGEGWEATDFMTGATLSPVNGKLKLPINGYMWRAVRFRPRSGLAADDGLKSCHFEITAPWATEITVESLDQDPPVKFMRFVTDGFLDFRGKPGNYKFSWHDSNNEDQEVIYELK